MANEQVTPSPTDEELERESEEAKRASEEWKEELDRVRELGEEAPEEE